MSVQQQYIEKKLIVEELMKGPSAETYKKVISYGCSAFGCVCERRCMLCEF